jgi:hypothetical protein
MTTTTTATLNTTTKGVALRAYNATPGMYAWHRGAYRLITSVEPVGFTTRVRFGRYSLTATSGDTLEVFPN